MPIPVLVPLIVFIELMPYVDSVLGTNLAEIITQESVGNAILYPFEILLQIANELFFK